MNVTLVVLAGLIGLTLGTLGAGGSILAVPVLVHVAGLPAPAATATSLIAVGSAAALGAWGHRPQVRLGVGLWFVPTGFVGAIAGAQLGTHLDDDVLLLAFSALVLVAAFRMLTVKSAPRSLSAATREQRPSSAGDSPVRTTGNWRRERRGNAFAVATAGVVVGFLTGLFGVGGGFIIVPALTIAIGLAMPEAIATSLLIVAANAAIALSVRGTSAVDWPTALALTAPMLAGSWFGARLGRRLDADNTRVAFASLLVIVSVLNAAIVLA
jgi:uncharacterized protein